MLGQRTVFIVPTHIRYVTDNTARTGKKKASQDESTISFFWCQLTPVNCAHNLTFFMSKVLWALIKGSLKNGKKIRLNVLIKTTIQYKIIEWEIDVPMVGLVINNETFIFVYREWAKEGVLKPTLWNYK